MIKINMVNASLLSTLSFMTFQFYEGKVGRGGGYGLHDKGGGGYQDWKARSWFSLV